MTDFFTDHVVLKESTGSILWEKVFLEILQNSQENSCARVFFNKVTGNYIKKETLAQVFSCEFFKIFKNTFLQNNSGRLLV